MASDVPGLNSPSNATGGPTVPHCWRLNLRQSLIPEALDDLTGSGWITAVKLLQLLRYMIRKGSLDKAQAPAREN